MHRHQGMAPQSPALRTVVTQAHGVAASAAVTETAGYPWRGELYPRKRSYPKGDGVIFVVATDRRPLTPCHPARARKLLTSGRAAVWLRYPFTSILKHSARDAAPEPLRLKMDPGSKVTGLALLDDATGHVLWAGEVTHRGQQVRDRLLKRSAVRRHRRQRQTRDRPA